MVTLTRNTKPIHTGFKVLIVELVVTRRQLDPRIFNLSAVLKALGANLAFLNFSHKRISNTQSRLLFVV